MVDDTLFIERGCFHGQCAAVFIFMKKCKQRDKINMTCTDRQGTEILPIHISSAIIVDMEMADILKKMSVFLLIQKRKLSVKRRHFCIKGEGDIGICILECKQMCHRIGMIADDVFDGQNQVVPIGNVPQIRIEGDVVRDIFIGMDAVLQMKDKQICTEVFCKHAIDFEAGKRCIGVAVFIAADVFTDRFFCVEYGNR